MAEGRAIIKLLTKQTCLVSIHPFRFRRAIFLLPFVITGIFSGQIDASPSFARPACSNDGLFHQGAVLAAAACLRARAAARLCTGPARQGLVAAVSGADADAE